MAKKWVMKKEPEGFPASGDDCAVIEAGAVVGTITPSLMTALGFELIEVPPIEFEATVCDNVGPCVYVPDSLKVGETYKFQVTDND